MTIRPLHDRILARRVVEGDKTSGGLFIPDNAREKSLEALVVSVGSGTRLANGSIQPPSVKPGDRILIAKYSEADVSMVGKDHIVVREADVLAVLEETSP